MDADLDPRGAPPLAGDASRPAGPLGPGARGVVPSGPRAYRSRIRARGPVVALVPPAAMGAAALALLAGDGSAVRGVLGFLLAMLAAPLLAVAGAPLRSGSGPLLVAVVASAVLHVALGTVSARRATRRPVATWGDFWREHAWLLGGAWGGVLLALVASNLVLGRVLL